jgi:glucosamine-6-phosphate deaminase
MAASHSPRVSVFPNERAAARALARRIVDALAANPPLVLGLPTGRTPVGLYHELAALAARGRADFSHATTFNLDEFLGLPPTHPGSYRRYMESHLFGRVNVLPARVNFLDGSAPDPIAECARYEQAISAAGGIDVQILGIGTNGHIGFNEPAADLHARTHRVRLKPETRRSNAALFGGALSEVPTEALSMGMATILQARSIVLLATGRSKADCIERMLNGPITPQLPASFLQVHRDVDVLMDEAAAEKLRVQNPDLGSRLSRL